jgi:Ankyrin repeats (many copies)
VPEFTGLPRPVDNIATGTIMAAAVPRRDDVNVQLVKASSKSDVSAMSTLLALGANVNHVAAIDSVSHGFGIVKRETPLTAACALGKEEAALLLLGRAGINIEAKNGSGERALHLSAAGPAERSKKAYFDEGRRRGP